MKALASFCALLCACACMGSAAPQDSVKSHGEEGRIIALESAWDQAEQNKDANALANLLSDSLVYVDYDGSFSNKQQFLAGVKNPNLTSDQIFNEGITVHLHGNNVAVSTGIYRERGVESGKPFQRRGRFTNVWFNQNGNWQCIASQSTLISH